MGGHELLGMLMMASMIVVIFIGFPIAFTLMGMGVLSDITLTLPPTSGSRSFRIEFSICWSKIPSAS